MKRADMHTSLVMWHLVPSLILTRIDSCNSILINLPASTVAPLQRVENTAARLVLGLDRRAHITPSLKQLHWFPVRQRITYKVATFMHSVFHQNSPPYLRDLVQFVNDDLTKRRLRSETTRTAATVRARTKLGDRAFSVAAPSTWNSLPPLLRHIDSYRQFRKQLKHICSNRLLTLSWFYMNICFPPIFLWFLYVPWRATNVMWWWWWWWCMVGFR